MYAIRSYYELGFQFPFLLFVAPAAGNITTDADNTFNHMILVKLRMQLQFEILQTIKGFNIKFHFPGITGIKNRLDIFLPPLADIIRPTHFPMRFKDRNNFV